MCGLVGAFGTQLDLDSTVVERCLKSIEHRGPDDAGSTFPSTQVFFGHRRLSILDLSIAGHQPMKIANNWIIYNGEIYNHLLLRQEWLSDEKFDSTSDTETLLRLLNKYGLQILPQLKGMFAGAWFNSLENKVYLFRDSLGIKPLFFQETSQPSCVFFASEIKALFEMTNPPRKINHEVLEQYLKFENYPSENTLFSGICSLKAGEIRSYSIDEDSLQMQSSQFVSKKSDSIGSKESLVEALETQIFDSVQSHLIADVPVGVYLSGGIDSSLVAMMASKINSNIVGFTGYFEQKDEHYDERALARLVARKANFELHEIKISPQDFIQKFDSIIYQLDQPRMGMGAFSQYVVAAEAAKQRKVILAGHGGDELFAGYPMHKAAYLLSSPMLSIDKFKLLSKLSAKDWPWFVYSVTKLLLSGRVYFAPMIWNRSSFSSSPGFASTSGNLLSELDNYYNQIYIPGLLEVEDRVSMAHGLETRIPLWSQDLVSFAQNIRIETKIKNGELKHLLKKVAQKWLPSELLSAPKRGFPTPLRLWFRKELLKYISDRLLDSPCKAFYDIISKNDLEKLIDSHCKRPLPFALDELRAHRIWTALCLESWVRQFRLESK